jgi:lipopolysaccharide export system protein LptC
MQNRLNAITALIAIALSFISCEKKAGNYPKIDIMTLPSLTRKDFSTVSTDSGKIQLILSAPIMESYEKTETPYTEFTSGINVQFYDGHEKPVASVTSKYAKYTDNKNLWELQDSVVAVNEAGVLGSEERPYLHRQICKNNYRRPDSSGIWPGIRHQAFNAPDQKSECYHLYK